MFCTNSYVDGFILVCVDLSKRKVDAGRDRLARGRGRLRDVEGGSVGVVTAGVVPVGG